MTTACGPSTLQANAWLVSMNGNANCMANRHRGGGSSGRPSGFPPEPPPPFPQGDHLLTTSSWSVTYVSGLKCYPSLRPSRGSALEALYTSGNEQPVFEALRARSGRPARGPRGPAAAAQGG